MGLILYETKVALHCSWWPFFFKIKDATGWTSGELHHICFWPTPASPSSSSPHCLYLNMIHFFEQLGNTVYRGHSRITKTSLETLNPHLHDGLIPALLNEHQQIHHD